MSFLKLPLPSLNLPFVPAIEALDAPAVTADHQETILFLRILNVTHHHSLFTFSVVALMPDRI